MHGKGHDLRIATWNVRSLMEVGALNNLKEIMKQYNIGILAIQEMRWKGEGIMKSGDFTVFYKGGHNNMFGTGFIIQNSFKNLVLNFTGFNDRISSLRVRGRFFNVTFINAHAPTEEKEEEIKEIFYDNLQKVIP